MKPPGLFRGREARGLRPGDRAWIVLGVGVAAWELLCPPDELLSEAADRYMLSHPWLTRAVAFTLAAHCCNVMPDRFDPIHQLFLIKQRLR